MKETKEVKKQTTATHTAETCTARAQSTEVHSARTHTTETHAADTAISESDIDEPIAKGQIADMNNRIVFKNHTLCAQFLRDYTGIDILKNIRPEDIEDVTENIKLTLASPSKPTP